MRTSLTLVDIDEVHHDVLVDGTGGDTVADLMAALSDAFGPITELWSGPARLDPAATLLDAGVAAGSVLHAVGPVPDPSPDTTAQAWVVSGPDAGLVVHLPVGATRLDGALLPGLDASDSVLLTTGPAGVVASEATGSVRRDGEPLASPRPVGGPVLLEIGPDLVQVGPRPTARAATARGEDLQRVVTRPPRLRHPLPPVDLDLPAPPEQAPERRLALLPLALPLALGVLLSFLLNPLFLLFTLLSPLLAVGTWWSDRRAARSDHRRALLEHATAVSRVQADVAARVREQTQARRDAAPDAVTVLHTALGPGPRLWERRPEDDDRWVLRLGTADLPAAVRLTSAGTSQEPPLLRDVPVTLDLAEIGVAGLAGPAPFTRAVARWLVSQAVVLQSPRDLQVWLLTDPADAPRESDWSWLRWLPHTEGELSCCRVGADEDTLASWLAELGAVVAARRGTDPRGTSRHAPDLLVVLDGARALRAVPGLAAVLRDGPAVGVHLVCLETEERLLPEECQAIVTVDATHRLSLRLAGGPGSEQVRADRVTPEWAEQVARALAPLRPPAGDSGEGQLPTTARLLDVLELAVPTAESVLARWGRTSSAIIGVGSDGPFTLDLGRDGPHVLVAGTTGSGKSELLQTLVASFALANRPDAMTFVLVDYKGGAAFQECARLPHTVGVVTDLDGPLVERALASLTAELTMRERMLAEAGTKDLDDYWYDGSPGGPLPRLVLVIDEFASLVEDLPDFVRGLVGIAQRGRSLGVHLVLATQRPSGVVSPEIRANTNLRIALRVTDAAESQDVLETSDAATIPAALPGRAAARTGPGPVRPFQTARVGGRAPAATARPAVVATPFPWSAVGSPLPAAPEVDEPEREATDLHAVVEAVRAAADALGGPPPRRPWLDPLPPQVVLSAVPRPELARPDARRPLLLPVGFGIEDVPALQTRRAAALDLEHGGHLLVIGAARSGRTTLLRTLAGSLALTTPASDAHLYVLDCGSGGLTGLAALPHCGAVVTRAEPDRVDRLLSRLTDEVTRRQALLAARGFADVAQQRQATADPLPYLVVLLDRWDGFTAAFDEIDAGRLTESVLRLLREGPGVGLRVVVTGDRSALAGRLSSSIEDVLVLPLADRGDYALAGLAPRQVPSVPVVGRALRPGTGSQVQIALLADSAAAAEGDAEVAALAQIAAGCTGRVGRRPFRVDVLPTQVSWATARALGGPETTGFAVAVGGDELRLMRVDLTVDGPGFTIAGPRRSGRSTALRGLAGDLLRQQVPLVVLAPRPSPLRDLAGHPAVRLLATETDPDPSVLAGVLEQTAGPLVVLVDDAEVLDQAAVGDVLQQVLREGRDRGHVLVLTGTTEELSGSFRGFAVDARRSRSGLLLSPASHLDGELLGVRLSRSAAFSGPPGRGWLVQSGQVQLVQVPVGD